MGFYCTTNLALQALRTTLKSYAAQRVLGSQNKSYAIAERTDLELYVSSYEGALDPVSNQHSYFLEHYVSSRERGLDPCIDSVFWDMYG